MPVNVLDVRALAVDLGGHRVLDRVTFGVRPAEFVGITGPNGGGKSTLVRAILGLVPTAGGDVALFGEAPGPAVLRRIGYVPQHAAHVEHGFPATAKEVVAMGLTATRAWPWQRAPRGADDVVAAMRATGVESLARRRIGEMSGGQRQRVLLAKALVAGPDLLVLDEPTTGVDAAARDAFAHLLTDLNESRGMTILLVSHDADVLNHAASRILVVDRTIASDGPPDPSGSTLEHLHGHGGRA